MSAMTTAKKKKKTVLLLQPDTRRVLYRKGVMDTLVPTEDNWKFFLWELSLTILICERRQNGGQTSTLISKLTLTTGIGRSTRTLGFEARVHKGISNPSERHRTTRVRGGVVHDGMRTPETRGGGGGVGRRFVPILSTCVGTKFRPRPLGHDYGRSRDPTRTFRSELTDLCISFDRSSLTDYRNKTPTLRPWDTWELTGLGEDPGGTSDLGRKHCRLVVGSYRGRNQLRERRPDSRSDRCLPG